jgi:hypothetical protein
MILIGGVAGESPSGGDAVDDVFTLVIGAVVGAGVGGVILAWLGWPTRRSKRG